MKTIGTIVAALFCLASAALSETPGKPVGVFEGVAAPRLAELLNATVFNPQWTADKPAKKAFNWENWNEFAAVTICYGGGAPLRLRDFTPQRIADAEKYVRDGGTLLIIADKAPVPDNRKAATRDLKTLLGADSWTPFEGKAQIQDETFRDCGAIPEVFEHMLKPPGAALTGLTTAKMLLGNESGALATVNTLGRGKVYFLNIRLTESLTPYRQPYGPSANAALEQYFPFAKAIHKIIMDAGAAKVAEKREIWNPAPLGPVVKTAPVPKPRQAAKLTPSRNFQKTDGGPVTLVRNGEPDALISLDGAGQQGAARRLNDLLKKMSGAELPAAAANAISADGDKFKWRGKTYGTVIRLKTQESGIKITAAGNIIEIAADSFDLGMMTFMREFLGYRMLWPGKSGEVYQTGGEVTVPAGELTDKPFLAERAIRNGYSSGLNDWTSPEGEKIKVPFSPRSLAVLKRIGWDPREIADLRKGHGDWWSVQRLGGRLKRGGGGNFYGWEKKYAAHPEYFALQFDGARRVKSNHVRICKGNPEVVRTAAGEIIEAINKKPETEYYFVSSTDGGYDIMCMCEECRKLDPQTALGLSTRRVFLGRNRPVFRYPGYTDRVLRFTVDIAAEVRKVHPQVKIFYLAYSSYAAPPLAVTELPENIAVTYVGLQYLNDEKLEKDRQVWNHWAGLAKELRLRPNLLLEGLGMPVIYTAKMAQDLRHCAETGMIGADFDSLVHNWGTQGLNYYVLAQMLWDPSLPVDEIIDDYCKSGFGPAAATVKTYFRTCEEITDRLAAADAGDIADLEDLTLDEYAPFHKKIPLFFSAEKMAELKKLLDKAESETAENSPERIRVAFLKDGLEFAALQAEFLHKYNIAKQKKELKEYTENYIRALEAIYRRQPFAFNYPAVAGQQWPLWRDCGWQSK